MKKITDNNNSGTEWIFFLTYGREYHVLLKELSLLNCFEGTECKSGFELVLLPTRTSAPL